MGQYKNQSEWGRAAAKARYAEGGIVTETRDKNEITPEKYMEDKAANSDPRNIYDDQGKIVDYDITQPKLPDDVRDYKK